MTGNNTDRSATRIQDDYAAGLFPHRAEYRPPEYIVYMERAAAALKTVRIVAYSGMVAFVILAAYGFFLIYQLTSDAHLMTIHMDKMSRTMTDMRGSIISMDDTMRALDPMAQHMANMDVTMQYMANTVGLIQHATSNLDRSFGPAMGAMNRMPFMGGGGGNRGYQGSPPYSPPLPPLVTPYPEVKARAPTGAQQTQQSYQGQRFQPQAYAPR
jgi:hypothetical protein